VSTTQTQPKPRQSRASRSAAANAAAKPEFQNGKDRVAKTMAKADEAQAAKPTAPAAKPAAAKPTITYDTVTVSRFRSAKCDERGHKNSHITEPAARRCAGDDKAKLVEVERWWGVKVTDGHRAQCLCRYGHKTRESGLQCVGGLRKSAEKSAQAAARQAPASPNGSKPEGEKLHSGAQGTIHRA
jgi:hypothetical protein